MVVLATASDASMSRGGVLMARGSDCHASTSPGGAEAARGSHVAGRLHLQAGTGVGLCP